MARPYGYVYQAPDGKFSTGFRPTTDLNKAELFTTRTEAKGLAGKGDKLVAVELRLKED